MFYSFGKSQSFNVAFKTRYTVHVLYVYIHCTYFRMLRLFQYAALTWDAAESARSEMDGLASSQRGSRHSFNV